MNSFDGSPPLKDDNRRTKSRRAARTRAWADPGGVAPVVDCMIVDVSEGGAKVMGVNGAELPDTFRLQIDTASAVGDAEVVWRKGGAVGVKLTKPAKS